MPRNVKRIKHLIKHHVRKCTNRGANADLTRCACAWHGKYKGKDKCLAEWCGKRVDPHTVGQAQAVLRRFMTAIDEDDYDPEGEREPLGTGQTFAEFVDEWRDDYAIKEGLSLSSLGTPPNPKLGHKGSRGMLDVIKDSKLGRMTLEEIAGASETIYKWLNTEEEAREWGDKTWTEYHSLLNRICDQATRWKRSGKPRMSVNPMLSIDRRTYAKPKHFKQRVLLEDVEDRLFEACLKLNRPQHLPNRNKLTQQKADAIRAEVERGDLQKHVAAKYLVTPSVISAIVKGEIWNPAKYRVGTKGNEMRRRLMMALDTGVRTTEMLLIKIKHVDWRNWQPAVAADGTEFKAYLIRLPAENTKGGKWTGEDEEVIAGTLRLSQELEARRFQLKNNPEAFLFGTEQGRGQQSFKGMWRKLFKLAGLDYGRDKGLVWHTTRHEFTSRVVENPANTPKDAQEAARHGDLKTTMGYMHSRNERKWTVAAGLDRVAGRGRR